MRILLLLVILSTQNIFAEVNTIARSPRGLLMGDAFTAVADDEYALFYNPAALGRHQGFSFNSFNPLITIINPLEQFDLIDSFPNTTAGMADQLIGIPVKTSGGITPGFRMGRFGFSAFYNTEVAFNLLDKTQPVLDLRYKEDRGFIMGYAFVAGNRLDSPDASGQQLSIGFSTKYLRRAGIKSMFPLLGSDLDSISGSDMDAITTALGKNQASGWGFDIGAEHTSANGNTRFINSLVMKDIFNMRLSHELPDSEVPAQDMAVNFGSAIQQKYELFSATFSVDIRNLVEEQEFMRRLHVGVEVTVPGLGFMAGWRTGYYSYGIMADIFLFKLYVGLFAEEIGPRYKQAKADQALIYLSLLNFRFDD